MDVERDSVPGRLVVARPLTFSVRVERGRHSLAVETGPVHRRTILLGSAALSGDVDALEQLSVVATDRADAEHDHQRAEHNDDGEPLSDDGPVEVVKD